MMLSLLYFHIIFLFTQCPESLQKQLIFTLYLNQYFLNNFKNVLVLSHINMFGQLINWVFGGYIIIVYHLIIFDRIIELNFILEYSHIFIGCYYLVPSQESKKVNFQYSNFNYFFHHDRYSKSNNFKFFIGSNQNSSITFIPGNFFCFVHYSMMRIRVGNQVAFFNKQLKLCLNQKIVLSKPNSFNYSYHGYMFT